MPRILHDGTELFSFAELAAKNPIVYMAFEVYRQNLGHPTELSETDCMLLALGGLVRLCDAQQSSLVEAAMLRPVQIIVDKSAAEKLLGVAIDTRPYFVEKNGEEPLEGG